MEVVVIMVMKLDVVVITVVVVMIMVIHGGDNGDDKWCGDDNDNNYGHNGNGDDIRCNGNNSGNEKMVSQVTPDRGVAAARADAASTKNGRGEGGRATPGSPSPESPPLRRSNRKVSRLA